MKNFSAMINARIDDYFKFTVVFLLFLLLAFDRDLAMIYLLIMFADYVWTKSDNFVSFKISDPKAMSSTQVYLEGLAGLGLFLVFSTFLVKFISPQSLSGGIINETQSIFQLLSTSTPILQGSKILTFVGWGVLVPIIETSFFNGRLLEGLATYAEAITGKKIPLSLAKISLGLVMVIFVVAALFTLFHITAKGISSIPLLITFVFSIISSVMVIRHRQLKGAILMHIVTNGAAVLSSFGLF
jgi:membrane protease YdiL (CAAX protease family)